MNIFVKRTALETAVSAAVVALMMDFVVRFLFC